LTGEEVDNLNQLRPKLMWSIIKILSEIDGEKLRDERGKENKDEEEGTGSDKEGKKKGEKLPKQEAKVKRKREATETCPVCELMGNGSDILEDEVGKVIELYKNQQPIEMKNESWIEEIVKQGAEIADFSLAVRTDNLPQKPNSKAEEIDKVLQEVGEGIMDIFAVSSVAAATFIRGESMAPKLTAMVILSGKAVWEIESKRRENLYGRAGAAIVKGKRTLTDLTFDSNTAYKNTNMSYSFYNNTNAANRNKKYRYGEDEAFANCGFASAPAGRSNWLSRFGRGNGGLYSAVDYNWV
jgi:hypothetical protein